ncbi:MAG: flagellar biosynthesis protein FlhA [Firmicutes bacterium]|nr:flagellar biosynthesis protein FlhA [Bacillota bacterium]
MASNPTSAPSAAGMRPGAGVLSNIGRYNDLFAVAGIVGIVAMMVIPVPPFLLDILLATNISLALLILMLSMNVQEALDFSVFPSLLLVTTLFRLALNVSTTRLILLHGYAGEIINAFGNFVVGGNYVVGFVVFLILVIIQFVVIVRGAERVAEVAARFTLDAMPGKQMSIDADLNTGLINESEARRRRANIEREADFYGAMDGASKFVKGDAIAALIILIINVLGGFIIGIAQRGMSITQALQTYTLLTIGDGLVAQIPALLISTATGIIVTRSASQENLSSEMESQLTSQPRVLLVGAGVLLVFALIPGLPKIPFLVLAAGVGSLAGVLLQSQKRKDQAAQEKAKEAELDQARRPENVMSLLSMDPVVLEIGYGLIPLVDTAQGGDLFDRVTLLRRQLALDLGVVIPAIRVRDNMQLKPSGYRIEIKGTEVAAGELLLSHFLAMDPGTVKKPVPGIATREPAFGLPALWIEAGRREEAEMAGYTVVDPPSVLATHLTEILKTYAFELLGRQEVKALLDNLKEEYPAVVEELTPQVLTLGEIQKVLQNLLREGIPIRNLVTICEALADYGRATKDPDLLTEHVRQALSRQISHQYAEGGVLTVMTLEPALEDALVGKLQQGEQGMVLAISPDEATQLLQAIGRHAASAAQAGHVPILVCDGRLRPHLKRLSERSLPRLVVLSYSEIAREVQIQSVGMVTVSREG